ncbi:MAG: peptidoglycan bridge formation glycyltransferase FemA/FemB family protein [bacterium]
MTGLIARFTKHPDLHQSPMYASLMREINWSVEGKAGSRLFYRTLGPFTIAKLQRPKTIDPDWINGFRKNHHALTTYIEPSLTNSFAGGLHVEPFAHSCTSLVDLKPSEQTILNSFSQKTRYNITRTLKKADIHVVTTPLGKLTQTQKDTFFSLHKSWSASRQIFGYPLSLLNAVLKSFRQSGDLLQCYQGHDLVGILLILYHGRVATYYAAFATHEGYSTFAPTLLTWTAMQTAKERGCSIFDFGGIYDPRYPKMYKKWIGFTHFKSGFNPTVISYPPTHLQLFW